MKIPIEDGVFDELSNIDKDLPLERRLFSEIMFKIYKLEQAINDNETVGLQLGDVIIDLKECRLIQGAGLVLFSGVRSKIDGNYHQPYGVFLSVQKLFPLNLTLLVLPRANATTSRRKIGFSIQAQGTLLAQSSVL